jgi:hypothetical protein
VSAAKLRIDAQYQLSGLSAAEQRRVKQQLVPAAIKVLQRYMKVRTPAAAGGLAACGVLCWEALRKKQCVHTNTWDVPASRL